MFINLVQRHEQSFYYFVYKVHAKGNGLFDNLTHWIELFITVLREGLGEPISLEFLLPHTGQERQEILEEVDKVALYHYKLKVLHEDKVRRRFGRAQGQNEADAEDEATQALLDSAVNEITLGQLVRADAGDIDAESNSEGESSEYETCSSNEDTDSSEEESEEDEPEVSSAEVHTRSPRDPRMQPVATVSNVVQQVQPPPQTRKLGPSLKRIRSMGSLSNPRRPPETPPPVPFLPKELKSSTRFSSSSAAPLETPPAVPPLSKGLKSPTRLDSSTNLPPARIPTETNFLRSRRSAADMRQTRPPPRSSLTGGRPLATKEKNKKREPLKPPELVHIPKLLAIFVEMVRSFIDISLDASKPGLDTRGLATTMNDKYYRNNFNYNV